jgi:hypothetical protein
MNLNGRLTKLENRHKPARLTIERRGKWVLMYWGDKFIKAISADLWDLI